MNKMLAQILASEFAAGIGYIDAHPLAAARLTAGASLWTRNKSLAAVAERLGLASDAAT